MNARKRLRHAALFLLTALFAFGMVGCGSKDDSGSNDPSYYKGSDFKGKGGNTGTTTKGKTDTQ